MHLETQNNNFKPSEQGNYLVAGITLLVIILLAVLIDVSSLKVWVERAGVWGPLVFILLKISTIVFAPLSGSPLYPLVGLLFGFWPGILYVILGDFLGYTISFWISRIFGRKFVHKLMSGKEEGMVARIVDHIGDAKGFFQACLTLFAMPEVLSYGAGLSRLSYVKCIAILLPFTATVASILVFFGSILSPDSDSLLISLGIPLLGAAVVITGGTIFLRSVKNKMPKN